MLSACQVLSWKFFNFFRVDNILIVLYQLVRMYQIGTHTHRTKNDVRNVMCCIQLHTIEYTCYALISYQCAQTWKALNLQRFRRNIQQFVQSTSPGGCVFSYSINWYTHPQTHFLDSKQHGTIFLSWTQKAIFHWSTRN